MTIIHESSYEKDGWINLEKEVPPTNEKVKFGRVVILDFGLENLEWESDGHITIEGTFSIERKREITLSNNKPTHWKPLKTNKKMERFHPTDIKGLSFEDAVKLAKENHYTVRKTKENGKTLGITDDFDLNRINVEVKDEIVVYVFDVS